MARTGCTWIWPRNRLEHQAAEVERTARSLGAVPADIRAGRRAVDRAGRPRRATSSASSTRGRPTGTPARSRPWWADCADPSAVAGFMGDGHRLGVNHLDGQRTAIATVTGRAGALPGAAAVRGLKTGKNRIHLDVAPYQDGDHAAAILALTEAGAVRLDIGQGAQGGRAVDRAGRPGGQRVLRAVAQVTLAQARTLARIEAELARLIRHDDGSPSCTKPGSGGVTTSGQRPATPGPDRRPCGRPGTKC